MLRRGATVKARVVGPDGQPVPEPGCSAGSSCSRSPGHGGSSRDDFHGDVRDGRCELHGLAQTPRSPSSSSIPKNQLGATAIFSVKAAKDGPITVRLEPCGMAMARLVDPKGKPLAGYRDPYLISMVVTPGPDRLADDEADKAACRPKATISRGSTPIHYADLVSDAQGRHHVPRPDPRRDLSDQRH